MNEKDQNQFIQEVLEESNRLLSEPVEKEETPKKDLHQSLIRYHILLG